MKFTFPPESKPLDGYTIKRAIHRGGFGEVYYAISDAGKEVALKLLQQNLEIELRGVTQCMNLKHPNLVTIFDIRTDGDGDHWIVMEYIHGKSMDKVIDEANGPLTMEEVLRWGSGIAEGLSFLHDRGIVHRDIKPANVFLENGVVKIGDVGLAKFITQSRRNAQTESVGTVYYMAPEVARGQYGHEVDVYSFGVVLYEILTGRLPFEGESTAEILMKHLAEKPDLTPVPKRLRPVLADALEKDPFKRTPSVKRVMEDFRKAVRGVEIPTTIPQESFDIFHQPSDESNAGWLGSTEGSPQTAEDRGFAALNPGHPVDVAVPDSGQQFRDDDIPDDKTEQLDRKAARHERIEARKAARHARLQERKAAHHERREERKTVRHARKVERKAFERGRKKNGGVNVAVAAAPKFAGSRTPAKPDDRSAQIGHWLKVTAIIVIVMAVIMPNLFSSMMTGLLRAALLGGLVYVIYRVVCSKSAAAKSKQAAEPIFDDVFVPPPPVPRSRRLHPSALGPKSLRSIPLRYRVTELTGSLSVSILCTAIITAAVMLLGDAFADPSRVALFGVTALAGSWLILATSKVFEGTRVTSGNRRIVHLLAGVLTGCAAFFVQQLTAVRFSEPDLSLHSNGLISSIGSLPLIEYSQPTLLGFVVFFAGLFVLRHWWRHADSLRSRRLGIGSVLLTTLLGLVWASIFSFPITWGVTWAAAISCIVHLSAVWIPPEDRRRLTEAKTHA